MIRVTRVPAKEKVEFTSADGTKVERGARFMTRFRWLEFEFMYC
jgi:hypothetical protein